MESIRATRYPTLPKQAKKISYGGLAEGEWADITKYAKESSEGGHFVQLAKLDHHEIGKAFDRQLCFVVRHNKVSEPFIKIQAQENKWEVVTAKSMAQDCRWRLSFLGGWRSMAELCQSRAASHGSKGQVWVEADDYKVWDHGTGQTESLKCIHTEEHNTIQMPKSPNDSVVITPCHFDWASGKFA